MEPRVRRRRVNERGGQGLQLGAQHLPRDLHELGEHRLVGRAMPERPRNGTHNNVRVW